MNAEEAIARIICAESDYDPDYLEPGNLPVVDGECSNGDPGHFLWREFVPLAKKILTQLKAHNPG